MLARLVAVRPTVSLASTAAATSTSTTTHATQQHVRAFSFFSSKSGRGGDGNGNKYKYFTANSSSSRRSSPPNGANGGGGSGGAASSKPKMDGDTTAATITATTVRTASATETADTTPTTTAKPQPLEDPANKGDSSPSPSSSSSTSNPAASGQRWTTSWQPQPVHAPLTAKDLNLHSFFSGHRPLLLLSQPSSSIFESCPDLQLSNTHNSEASRHLSFVEQLGGINLEDPPEATSEEDADAARLLNRALVVNRLGGAVSWEETLSKLGVVEERASFTEMGMGARDVVDVDVNGFDAYMDSTKRKRRQKMKKHKLKKRRRLQRSQRIKIGK